MAIGETVNAPVQQDSMFYLIRVSGKILPFDIIADKISYQDFPGVPGQIYMSQKVQELKITMINKMIIMIYNMY